jgi:hypothetical protein
MNASVATIFSNMMLVVGFDAGETILLISRILSVISCAINIFIYSHKAILKKSKMFEYLLVMSVVDFLYSLVGLIWQLLAKYCNEGKMCGEYGQYFAIAYTIAIPIYYMSSMALFNILMEIFLTLDRLLMILNKPIIVKKTKLRIIVPSFAVFCTVYYVPLLFQNKITPFLNNVWPNRTQYRMDATEFGLSDAGKVIPTVLSVIRLVLIFFVLFILNIITIVLFNTYQSRKKSMVIGAAATTAAKKKKTTSSVKGVASEAKANRKITIMLICISILYVCCNTPYLVFYSLSQINRTFAFLPFLNTFGLISIFTMLPLKTVIYLIFNRLYRNQFFYYVNKVLFVKLYKNETELLASLGNSSTDNKKTATTN